MTMGIECLLGVVPFSREFLHSMGRILWNVWPQPCFSSRTNELAYGLFEDVCYLSRSSPSLVATAGVVLLCMAMVREWPEWSQASWEWPHPSYSSLATGGHQGWPLPHSPLFSRQHSAPTLPLVTVGLIPSPCAPPGPLSPVRQRSPRCRRECVPSRRPHG